MPEVVGEAFVAIRPETTGFSGELQTGLRGALTGFAGALAGVFAVSKVKDFFSSTIDEATEAQKVTADTEAVLKSMGKQANVTADDVANLATSISNKTGIDDEQIQSGENLILTFGKVRNEVGKGNDVFNRATKAAVDLSARFKQDVSSSAIQLGKALNDPIAGVTALRRVGVQLTDQQEEQIKAFVASGNVLEAQKIILGEVEKEAGGAAAAQATGAEKAQVAWKNLQETIGQALLPVLNAVLKVIQPIAEWLAKHQTIAVALAAVISGALVAAFAAWAISATAAAAATIAAAAPVLALIAAVAAIGAAIVLVWTKWDEIWNFIKDHPAYAVIIAILAAPIALFVAIIGGLKFLWENWREIWAGIQRVTEDVVNAIVTAFNDVVTFFENLPGMILAALAALPDELLGLFARAMQGALNAVINFAGSIVDVFVNLPGRIVGAIGNAATWLIGVGQQIIAGLWEGIENGLGWLWGKIKGIAGGIVDTIAGALGIGSPSKVMRGIGEQIMAGLTLGLESRKSEVEAFFAGLGPAIEGSPAWQWWSMGNRTAGVDFAALHPAPAGTNISGPYLNEYGKWVVTAFGRGGSFRAGQGMLVGERGPELVSFGRGGTVTPNDQLGGGPVFNIYAPTSDPLALAMETQARLRVAAMVMGT